MRLLDAFQTHGEHTLELPPGGTISQSFTSLHNNLAGVRLVVLNPNLGGHEAFALNLTNEKHETLATLPLTQSNLGWGSTLRFDFAPIADSKNKTYEVTLSQVSSPSASEKPLSVSVSNGDWYPGILMVNSKKLNADLEFETFYQPKKSTLLLDLGRDALHKATGDVAFSLCYILLLGALLRLLFIRLKKLVRYGG